MAKKQFDNNYIVTFSNPSTDVYTVDAITVWDIEDQSEQPFIGYIPIPPGDLDYATFSDFMGEMANRPVFHADTIDTLSQQLLTNFPNIKLQLDYDLSGKIFVVIAEADYELITSTDNGDGTFHVSADLSFVGGGTIERDVSEKKYFELVSVIISHWSHTKLVMQSR